MVALPGYTLHRCDRTGRQGGGVGLYLRDSIICSIIEQSTTENNLRKPEFIVVGFCHSVILGDFNADMAVNTYDSVQLSTFITSSSMYLVPFETTHHLKNSSTFIDLCIVDDALKLKHFAFILEISGHNWTDLLTSTNIEEKVDILNHTLIRYLDKHAPLQRIKFKNLPAPWLTDEIKRAMQQRDKLKRAWRRNRNCASYENFRVMRNHVQNIVRTAKKEYYLSVFNQRDNPNLIWSRLRHLGLIKAKSTKPLVCNVDEINLFFAGTTDSQNVDSLETTNANCSSKDDFNENKLFFKYVLPATITKAFARITSNAIGSDGISAGVIKIVLPYLMPVFENIYNFSLMDGSVPKIWKSALITPIPKIEHLTAVQHYRPIAILPTISKALERIVSDQIIKYLTENNLLDPYQFAYRKNSSTQTCVIRMLEDIRYAADNRKVTVSIFFDFSKAFDRVQHNILINKLKMMGFSWVILY
ncbi:uncharacterized protein LOC109861131 [Pseudomyrmex gracilis]|uniref:uncharacterized protein LOC109861131 n=1 Tax=Pseudomyrmex gracilis TaxID=219809 RepID=UPI000994E9AA|nr:uncharacterized protein LOC109861131 [Pseudomyrmex gracilis]